MGPKLAKVVVKTLSGAAMSGALLGACWVGSRVMRQPSARGSWAALAARIRHAPSRSALTLQNGEGSTVARLERTIERDGAQLLRGETGLELLGARARVDVVESARIGASGRLDRAEVDLAYTFSEAGAAIDGEAVVHEMFDATRGKISIEHANGEHETRTAENRLPWIYLPVRLPSGAWASTPIAVSVAHSAARAGPVALQVAAGAADVSLMADQFQIDGGSEEWLVLGDDLATFAGGGRGALLRLKIAALGVLFQAQPELDPPWAASSPP
jgi:hypothetical protein